MHFPSGYGRGHRARGGNDRKELPLASQADRAPSAAPARLRSTVHRDNLAIYRSLLGLVRWCAVLAGVVLTAADAHRSTRAVVLSALLVTQAAYRTFRPLRWPSRGRGLPSVLSELAICLLAVGATGWWASDFAFTLVTPISAAGFAEGFADALGLAAATCLVVTVPTAQTTDAVRRSASGSTELLLAGLIAAYGRQIFGQAELRTTTALSRLSDLTEANDLLQGLNALAQRLPASLDLRETVSETIAQIRTILRPDAIAVFLWNSSLRQWTVAGAEGIRLNPVIAEAVLPVPVREAATTPAQDRSARLVDLSADGPGMTPAGRVGIYAPLVARRSLVGVIAVESGVEGSLDFRDRGILDGIAEQAGLAIDNARWFSRLRTVGAEEERSRIARDLHDRVAQTLAYLAFELDRVIEVSAQRSVTLELENLRTDVRRVVTEVRDTLYDLRTDVTESQSLPSIIEAFLDRVRDRTALDVSLIVESAQRLPLPLEREVWRIGQEAITNVEHHAHAKSIRVSWTVNERSAELEVADDGLGFPLGSTGRMDSYGLLGMRERADAIGATLDIDTAPGQGTRIRLHVEVS